ncbi:GerAB/ArcD/ProY family transporter [Cytobacillus sp. Hz8]|uniref:GerAB/ArcD/ProY family transporter n=1 Tax=Cytobacillus sp. Hz8 TaxID=3347168 RepID=UPI0035D92CAA
MSKEKISAQQLFCLMFMFEIGSAIVVGIGIQAKQDAWIAVLLAMLCGLLLFLIFSYFHKKYPSQPLTTYVKVIFGKYLGTGISVLYILYFLYISARVLRDLGGLIVTSTLEHTPIVVVCTLMMLIVVYGVVKGIEVIGRSSEMIFLLIIMIGLLGIIFTCFGGIIEPKRLLPILENGWKPVLKTVFPQILTFPFGEMIVFTMFLPYLNKAALARRIGLLAILASGIVLSFTIALEISILGPGGVAVSQFPLLDTISRVSIANFIERLDVLVVLTLIFGVFIKIMIFFFASVKGVYDLFQFKSNKQWRIIVIILGILEVIVSYFMASSYTEHIKIGLKIVPLYLHLPMQIMIPCFLLIVAIFRKKMKNNL